MNNEPIAFVTGANKFDPVMVDTVLKVGTPLYTHPADLTDEEITEIFDTTFEVRDYQDSFIKFAKAILRKAQEK
jgi:acetylglutamate synthase